jgi:hypothetical protein
MQARHVVPQGLQAIDDLGNGLSSRVRSGGIGSEAATADLLKQGLGDD